MKPTPCSRDTGKRILPLVACILLSGLVVWWYLFLNQHLCLFYREQSQMFLFSGEYFLQYLEQPGGITSFAASFLTQFFYYPPVGTGIYLLVTLLLYQTFKLVLEKFFPAGNLFFAAFIPALLFLAASARMYFDIADELAVILALSGFIVWVKLSRNQYRYLLIPVTVTVLYLLAGGCILLSLILFVLYSFGRRQQNCLKQIPAVILSLSAPAVLWYFFYLVAFADACAALTPFRYPDVQWADFRVAAWLSVCIIPASGILCGKIARGEKRALFCNAALAVATLFAVLKQYHPHTENIIQMGYDAENGNWENVINTGKKVSVGPLSCFYINLALQKTGQLAETMFHYDQIGTPGLVIDMPDHFSCQAKSELFYRLGLMNEAQHYAFESMVGHASIKEPDVRNLKRLLKCAVIRQDSALSAKYEKILNKTLFHRNRTKRQDVTRPPAVTMKRDMFVHDTPSVLEAILEASPDNTAAFEYLMAYYMLEWDYEKAKKCYDLYFSNFSYPKIPTHYAEFLVLYKRLNHLDDDFYEHYPVSRDVRERFDMMDILVSSKMDRQIQKTLENSFKDTYWFYVRFPLINVQTVKKDERSIY